MSSTHNHSSRVNSRHANLATMQDEFRREISRRFREIRGVLRTTVIDNDALALERNQADGPVSPRDLLNQSPSPASSFGHTTDSAKQNAFEDWFEEVLDTGLLEPLDREDVVRGRHYTAPYMDSSYKKGLNWADRQMRDAGIEVGDSSVDVITQLPAHEEALETIYTRTYSQLEGITNATDQEVSRVLANGLAEGASPRTMGSALNDRVDAVEGKRGLTLARSETMNAHAQATGTRYEEMGVDQVDILTSNPCSLCRSMERGAPYTPREIRSLIPRHPNCMCVAIPHTN